MTNDAKLGMLAGVLGVIVAAVFFTNTTPRASDASAEKERPVPQPVPPPAAAPARPPPEANAASLPATPVPRTRNDVDAQPASRQVGGDEEP